MIRTITRRLFGLGTASGLLAAAAPGYARSARAVETPPLGAPLRVIVVHWKIKPEREAEFLDYWATRASVADRSGLVGEFLSSVADRAQHPWINLQALSPRWASFFNVGLWRDAAAFQDQIGRYIDNTQPPFDFEAERRERVFLVPERWRTGHSALPAADPPGVV